MGDPAVADLLERAAAHIETYGWHQGGFVKITVDDHDRYLPPERVPVCAMAAINIAGGGPAPDRYPDGDRHLAARALIGHLRLASLDDRDDVAVVGEWNDHPLRTVEQVVAALRDTAASVRTGGE